MGGVWVAAVLGSDEVLQCGWYQLLRLPRVGTIVILVLLHYLTIFGPGMADAVKNDDSSALATTELSFVQHIAMAFGPRCTCSDLMRMFLISVLQFAL